VTENNQPRPDDAVQGTQSPQPLNALVLGDIEGLKQRLANTNGKQKIAALKEALKYGQEGLELLIHALQDKDWQVSHASYGLLQENVEPELKQALQKYDPYLMCFQIFSWCSREFVHSIAFSPDGSTLASGSDDTTIKLWDINSGELKTTLTGHTSSVHSIAFSPDGSTLASGSDDTTIKLWDINSGEIKNTLTGYSDSVSSPDGSTLASSSEDKTIKFWDINSGELKSGEPKSGELKNTPTGCVSWVHSIAFSPDGSTLASCSSDETIKLWDINSGELKNTLTGHSGSVSSIAFSPDGSTLASYRTKTGRTSETTFKLWKSANLNLSKQEPVKLFHCYTALKEVLKSGQVGLDQVIDALDSESWEVHEAAYALLLTREDPRSQQALQNYTRCTLNSEVNLDYTRLRSLLARQRWKEAEAETEDIMLQISGQNRGADVNSILSPCTFWDDLDIKTELKCSIPNADLHTIYDLWREYSNAHSDSFSQQTLSLNFWMMVKTKLEEIFKEQQRIKSNYGVDRMSAEYGEAMRNRD
jgi:sugar lactone lactonase YvrE